MKSSEIFQIALKRYRFLVDKFCSYYLNFEQNPSKSRKRRKPNTNITHMNTSFQTAFAMEQEEQPSFRRHVDDRRYYEVPARFPLNTAYMEVLYDT